MCTFSDKVIYTKEYTNNNHIFRRLLKHNTLKPDYQYTCMFINYYYY